MDQLLENAPDPFGEQPQCPCLEMKIVKMFPLLSLCIFLSGVEALQPDVGFHRQAGHRAEGTAEGSLHAEVEALVTLAL